MTSFSLHKWPRIPNYEPSIVGTTVWGYCHIPMDRMSMFSNTLYMSNVDVGSSGWGGCQPQPWCDDIILTPQVTQNPKLWAKEAGYNCLRLPPFSHKQHINMLKHFVYVLCGCRKHFELAVSLNHDVMTSFWLHKWPRTPKSEPSSVGITVWGYCYMPMDSILMCSNTLNMSNMDAGSSLSWLSVSTMT